MRRWIWCVAAVVIIGWGLPAWGLASLPTGYETRAIRGLVEGLEVWSLGRPGLPDSVKIGHLKSGAQLDLHFAWARGPRRELTSSICARWRCVLGIDAGVIPGRDDFYPHDQPVRPGPNLLVDWVGFKGKAAAQVQQTIGGHPVILSAGQPAFNPGDELAIKPHPRTVVGWNAAGEIWFVTFDGRTPELGDGLTMVETAQAVQSLGATEALNFDGGGSTTFVVRGKVENRPSRSGEPGDQGLIGLERPVVSALVLVPRPPPATPKPLPTPKPASPARVVTPVPTPEPPLAITVLPVTVGQIYSGRLPEGRSPKLLATAVWALAVAVVIAWPASRCRRRRRRHRRLVIALALWAGGI